MSLVCKVHTKWILTVDALADLDDLTKRHGFVVFSRKVRQNTGSESDLFLEVTLGESEVTEFQLGRNVIAQVGVHDAERVEVGDVMATNLVGTN